MTSPFLLVRMLGKLHEDLLCYDGLTRIPVSGILVTRTLVVLVAGDSFDLTQEFLMSSLVEGGNLTVEDASLKLSAWTSSYGIDLDTSQIYLVVRHLKALLEKNKSVNLTSIKEPELALVLHALDSLLFFAPLASAFGVHDDSIKCLDMGTGGGFPGIPLACGSSWSFVLLDSVGKKVDACTEFAKVLGLDSRVSAIHCRLEDYASIKSNRGSFDLVVARALAPLDVLIEYASPLVANHGYVLLSKGTPDAEEREHAEVASRLCSLRLVSTHEFELPDGMGHRTFFLYQRSGMPSIKLPRKIGDARRKPLYELAKK